MSHFIKMWFIRQSLHNSKRITRIMILLSLILITGLSGNILFVVKWLGEWMLPEQTAVRIFPSTYDDFADQLPHIVIDEDVMKLLPQTIKERVTWENVRKEFGSTDMAFIAFGLEGKSVFDKKLLASLWDVSKALEEVAEVDEVKSISTANRMDSDEGFLEISDLQPSRNLTADEIRDIEQYLGKFPSLKKRMVSRHGDYVNIMIKPQTDIANNVLRDKMVEIAGRFLGDYEIHYGGMPYIFGTIPVLMLEDVLILMILGIGILITVLAVNFRSVTAVKLVWSVIVLSLLSMMGFMGWVVTLTGSEKFHFTMVNSSMPIILLTIAAADGVHIFAKFFRELRKRKHVEEAIRFTMDRLLLPVFLTSLTTVVAFLSLIFAPIEQFTGYGLTISLGITWAWLLSSLFLPAMIVQHKWDLNSKAVTHQSFIEKILSIYGRNIIRYRKAILGIGSGIVLIAAFGILLVKVEVDFTKFFKPGSEIRNSIDFMNKEMTGVMDIDIRFEGDLKSPDVLKKIQTLQEFVDSHPNVYSTFSIVDVVKQMHRAVMDDDPEYETIPDSRDKVNNLFTLYSMSGDPEDFSSLVDYNYQTGLMTALTGGITSSMIVEFVQDTEDMIQSVAGNNIKTTITGMLVIMRQLVDLVIRSAFTSIVVSILMIFLISWIFFKKGLFALLAITPLISAVILNFGLMGLFGIELSHVTAILSAIIIGVGVDFALHYIAQYRNISKSGVSPENLTREVVEDVGYPIILDAVSNLGFGALLFSVFVPVQYIGGLLIFAMISTSVGTLTILAVLAELMKDKLIEKENNEKLNG
ncbi:MAG TPA: hypothetical protein ENH49_01000 [Candidatus Marinimicrobia bacterium]|nr:hypothetical protein [Candidatus Neomarinimicrobiota bacterium]